MKCSIENSSLVVRGLFREKFHAVLSEIRVVKVMMEHDYYGPFTRLRQWLIGNEIRLRFVMLKTNESSFTVDVKRDTGAQDVLKWLTAGGWDIPAAIEQAKETPLVRTIVRKRAE